MSLIDPAKVVQNLIALGILFWVGFLIYSKMDREKLKSTTERLKKLFGGKDE